MTNSKLWTNPDILNAGNSQSSFTPIFNTNDYWSSTNNNFPPITQYTHATSSSIYSEPIWLNNSFGANAGSGLPTPTPGAAAPAATLVGAAGGFQINLIWDTTVSTAPATFQAGIIQAAQLLCNSISNNIVLNIGITCSGTGGGASAGPTSGYYESYSTVYSNLISHAAAGDTTFSALPTGTSVQGQAQVAVWDAQLKLWGLATPAGTTDGSATFATDINASLLPGVALHELTHAMGRIPYGTAPDIFDLFRFTAPGTMLFSGTIPAAAAYFSLDGGKTILANYGTGSDPSDFLNTGVQGATDAFNEYYSSSTLQTLSAIDLKQLDAIGYTLTSATPPANTGSIATFLSSLATLGASSYVITDTSANIVPNLDLLQTNIGLIKSISQTDTGVALGITAAQSVADNAVLSKISGAPALTISGTTGADTLQDTAKSIASLTGGLGIDTFIVSGNASITDLGADGADSLNVATGGIANATINTAWTASAATFNNGTANITTSGLAVDLSAVTTGTNGFKVTNTGVATTLTGSALNDTLIGGTGDDTLTGGLGINTLTGGAGVDTFNVTGTDTITDLGNGGADVLTVAAGATANATINTAWTATAATSNNGTATITTAGLAVNLAAVTTGTNGFNVTNTGVATTLTGSAFNDTLIGGTGNDTLVGGLGINTLTGGTGIDTFNVTGSDTITDLGTGGADVLIVGAGATANATVKTAWTASAATSNNGTANITTAGLAVNLAAVTTGANGFNVTNTGTAATLTGSALADTLIGGTGNDSLVGGLGNDSLTGGAGVDTFTVASGTDTITDLGNGGADVLTVAAGATANATLYSAWTATSASKNSGTVNITTSGLAVNLASVTATGTNGFIVTNTGTATTLTGSGLADTLTGGTGNDTLMGGAGNDILAGGLGTNALTGGTGIDTFNITGLSDIINDLGAGGADVLNIAAGASAIATINAAWTATAQSTNNGTATINTSGLAVNLSAITTGTNGFTVNNTGAAATLTGSAFDDILTGGTGKDTLIGGNGNDILIGGLGNDTLTGGAGSDYFVFNTTPNTSSNKDTITDFVSGTDKLEFSKSIFTGITTAAGTGNGAALTANEFISSTTATAGTTATSHFIYNSTSGVLYYDADANGAGAAVQVALIGTTTHPALVAADFLVIA